MLHLLKITTKFVKQRLFLGNALNREAAAYFAYHKRLNHKTAPP
jgi:hypothetical protein